MANPSIVFEQPPTNRFQCRFSEWKQIPKLRIIHIDWTWSILHVVESPYALPEPGAVSPGLLNGSPSERPNSSQSGQREPP